MSHSEDVDISRLIDRLEEIAEMLEDGDIGLERAKELREEADEHLETLRDALDVGDGDIIELDDVDPGGDTME
jgi:exodeoxyribonuclease VII small subunit